ncbi:MAG: tripartite tricarboxylate transporter substrate binding protein [Ramlibacter sp.]|nr:tripartite tricarboxylate transporter substrate binding protein [Ramlibacter sp.]
MTDRQHLVQRRHIIGAAAACCALGSVGPLRAQGTWPDRPVRLVVGFPPGGGVDVMARIVSQPLSEVLGKSIVVDNKPGASSNLAMIEVARAPADGYSILIGPTTVESANPFLYKAAANPATDLLPVAGIGRYQLHLVVRNGFPGKDLAELIAYARNNPGKLNYASAGAGTTPHLVSELFLQQAGIQALHVPYRGSAPALQAVLAGEADFVMDPGISVQHVKAGKVQMFGVASGARSRQLPDVPTMSEGGVQGLDFDTWVGLWAPVGTPEEARSKLARGLSQVLAQPAVQQKMQALNGEALFIDTPQFRSLLERETRAFSGLIKSRKIAAE